MRKKIIALTLALSFVLSVAAYGEDYRDTFTTGKDWLGRMNLKEKFLAVYAPALLFKKFHIPIRRPIEYYIPAIDEILLENPYLEKEDVANIFASTLYAYEPESRPGLLWLSMEMAPRDIHDVEGYKLTLLLDQSPEENTSNESSPTPTDQAR